MAKTNKNYTSKQIIVLEGLAPVRKRPAMYIGTTGKRGLHHCLFEIVDNSIDEALGGYAKNVWVILHSNNSVTVADDGRGFPVDIMPKYKKSALEVLMTKLHAGGKFEGQAYKISGGLHGVGSSVVNALSSWLRMEVRRDGKIYTQEYKKGVPQYDVKTKEKTDIKRMEKLYKNNTSGSTTTFQPDPLIFKEIIEFDPAVIKKSLRDRAYLISGIYFHFYDEKSKKEYHFYFEGGIISLIKNLNKSKTVIHEPIYIRKEENDEILEVAIQYNEGAKENVSSFVNIINTIEGGAHVAGFKTALTRTIKDYAAKLNGKGDTGKEISGPDTLEGLTAVISLKMPSKELQFEGQTKSKLGNSEVQPFVAKAVREGLATHFEEHPSETKIILAKVLLTVKARKAAKAAREAITRKGIFDSLGLPGKLADCQSKSPEESELYIVEGDSAGGSAKQGRDRKFQAILPLRGKILNTEKASLDRVIAFPELKDLIVALNMGIGETLDPKKLRYHRIIIMTDADVDGAHIATLLLTFFFRHLPEVILGGYLYIAQPPLYKISSGKKEFCYVYTEEEKEKVVDDINKKGKTFELQRYKGLGEMNPDQLWETTMNPKKRLLKRTTIIDAQKADEIFITLMGSDVPPRRRFIQTRAKLAELDI